MVSKPANEAFQLDWPSFLCLSVLLCQKPLVLFLIVPKLGSIAIQGTVIIWLPKQALNREEDRPHTASALILYHLNVHEYIDTI